MEFIGLIFIILSGLLGMRLQYHYHISAPLVYWMLGSIGMFICYAWFLIFH